VVCEGATTNPCGGCESIDPPLGSVCGTCGQRACDPDGAATVVCVEPDAGCDEPITCDQLGCDTQGRTCTAMPDVDANCGSCLPTYVALDTLCVRRATAPTGVSASTDRANDIALVWQAAAEATGYRVHRCTLDCANEASWIELTDLPVTSTSFVDQTVASPAAPSATTTVDATQDRTLDVVVTWAPVVAELATRYQYRVVTVGAGDTSAPSSVSEGHVAERPVLGYEVQIDQGAWVALSGLSATWSDGSAAPAQLTAGSASATLGTYPEYVRLSSSGAAALPGTTRKYRVRATTAYGPAPASVEVSGWRVAGPLARQWERSAAASADAFTALVDAEQATFDDTTAPADGSVRWYRLVVSAQGADPATTSAVSGSRQPPPGVPGGVTASSDRVDQVLVSWAPVSGAIGYHVYRDGTKLTTGTGVAATSFADLDAPTPTAAWLAPSGVSATTTDSEKIVVTWTAPTQPSGAPTSYRVSAVNGAGEGTPSAQATGWRVGPLLDSFEVEVKPAGQNAVWTGTGDTKTTWSDSAAPAPSITPGTIAVSQGTHRASVTLASTGAAANAGADVTYRVRAKLVGASPSPASTAVVGHRAVGPLSYQWQRSAGTTATGFAALDGATSASFSDATADTAGAKKWYQLVLSATGATSATLGPTEGWRLAFVAVSVDTNICGLTNDGKIWCTPTTSMSAPLAMPAGVAAFTQVAVGDGYQCARSDTGDTYCWGSNDYGQLGDGSLSLRPTPTKVATNTASSVAVYLRHTCIGGPAGARCWGDDSYGQLGNNTTGGTPISSPVTVVTSGGFQFSGVLQIEVGSSHSCARRSQDVYCWGRNTAGQLGNGLTNNATPYAVPVSGLTATAQIALGGHHSCARLASGEVRCWGANEAGQLGDGTQDNRSTPVIVAGVTATAIAAGNATTCALLAAGTVSCWGDDEYGQLGNGNPKSDSVTPVTVIGVTGATSLDVGFDRACAVVSNALRCWASAQGTSYAITLP